MRCPQCNRYLSPQPPQFAYHCGCGWGEGAEEVKQDMSSDKIYAQCLSCKHSYLISAPAIHCGVGVPGRPNCADFDEEGLFEL